MKFTINFFIKES